MKATELRIGNYVTDEKGERIAVVEKIVDEYNDKNITAWNLKNSAFGISDERIHPIPLTEQWLKDFGFKVNSTNEIFWMYDDIQADFHFRNYGQGFYLWCGDYKPNNELEIKHVHTLQNLYFALTGKELTK